MIIWAERFGLVLASAAAIIGAAWAFLQAWRTQEEPPSPKP